MDSSLFSSGISSVFSSHPFMGELSEEQKLILAKINEQIIEKSGIKDLIPIVKMQTPCGVISYLDYVYDGSVGAVNYTPFTFASPLADAWKTNEGNVPKVLGLQMFSKFIQAETNAASCSLSREQILDLDRSWGIDVITLVEGVLINESARMLAKKVITKIKELAEKTASKAPLTKFQKILKFIYKYFNKIFKTKLDIKLKKYYDFVYDPKESTTINMRKLLTLIFAYSNLIMQESRRGPANVILTNCKMATLLQDMAGFSFRPLEKNIMATAGSIYPIGHLNGLTIFVDPNMNYDEEDIYIFRVNKQDEPGLILSFYDEGTSLMTISESTMAPRIAIKTRYALAECGFYPQTNFRKLSCNIGNNII